MKAPSSADRVVTVGAYLTDEAFGYTHWRAAQFSAPQGARRAVLVLCDSEADQRAVLATLQQGGKEPT